MIYQNTKLFWVTVAAIAILSMFHSSISLGNPVNIQCPPKLRLDATNRLWPIWHWKVGPYFKESKCQLDNGEVVKGYTNKIRGYFRPNKALPRVHHTFNVKFTCTTGFMEEVTVEYNTNTGKMTVKTNIQDDLDTPKKVNKPNVSTPVIADQRVQSPPAPANGEKSVYPPTEPTNVRETKEPHVQEQNACNDKPPRKFTMSGRIVDAKTGRGISGAKFVVLVPDTLIYEYDAFLDSSSILSQAVTDKSGNYTLSRQLRNSRKYSMFIGADGYKRKKLDEQVMESCYENLTKNFTMQH